MVALSVLSKEDYQEMRLTVRRISCCFIECYGLFLRFSSLSYFLIVIEARAQGDRYFPQCGKVQKSEK